MPGELDGKLSGSAGLVLMIKTILTRSAPAALPPAAPVTAPVASPGTPDRR